MKKWLCCLQKTRLAVPEGTVFAGIFFDALPFFHLAPAKKAISRLPLKWLCCLQKTRLAVPEGTVFAGIFFDALPFFHLAPAKKAISRLTALESPLLKVH